MLLPDAGRGFGSDPAETELADLVARGRPGGRWVTANMITTLDGAAYGRDGRSGSINGPADLRVFSVLRALADVVLVGAGTARAEGYRAPRTPERLRAVRASRTTTAAPALAVVTRSGDLAPELLADSPHPWVFTTSGAAHLGHLRAHLPPERLHVSDDVDLAAVLAVLADAGLPHVLTEGGPSLLSDLVARDLVDELFLTTAPVLVGGDAARPTTGAWFDPQARAAPVHLLHADGVLLGRWSLRGPRLGP
nr:dihydrofolate reductase family protein [Cellulomonas sp. APG4]